MASYEFVHPCGLPLAPGRAVEVFYDGDCPLCAREVRWLKRLDRRARIQFTDIATTDFIEAVTPDEHADFMARIRGRLADGTHIEGIEVFRQLYAAAGFGWIVAITRLPGLSQLVDLGYRLFAKNRLRLTGRCARDGVCAVPSRAG